jgi:hypothetical protein
MYLSFRRQRKKIDEILHLIGQYTAGAWVIQRRWACWKRIQN